MTYREIGDCLLHCSYGVCTLPRCGGFYLDECLKKAGLGLPSEYFRKREIPGHLTLEDLWTHHQANGIFAARFHWEQRGVSRLASDFDKAFPTEPRWIHLVREDIDSQARSWLTALQKDSWYGNPIGEYLLFDESEVIQMKYKILRQNQLWREWFQERGFSYLPIVYEKLVVDSTLVVENVRQWVNAV